MAHAERSAIEMDKHNTIQFNYKTTITSTFDSDTMVFQVLASKGQSKRAKSPSAVLITFSQKFTLWPVNTTKHTTS